MTESKLKLKVPKPHAELGGNFGQEQDFFLENLSLMLGSNLPISQALESLKNETKNRKFKRKISQIQEDVDNGLHLWEAFKRAGILPGYSLSLIKIGEESGKLTQNLKVVTDQQQKDSVLRSRIRTAMLYPSMITALMLIIGTGISWFILPRLSNVFINLRLQLPLSTRLLISFGQFLQHSGYYAIPLFFIVLFSLFYLIFIAPKTKIIGQKLLFALPGVGNLIQQVEISRFGYMLGTMLSSGVPLVESVSLLEEAATFNNYKKFYSFLKVSLEEGNSFKESFKNYPRSFKLIPGHLQEIIVASEQSGRLEETFLKLAVTFEQKSEDGTKNLTVILEPALLIIVWFGVVAVALAVVLPLYQLVGGLRDSVSSPPQIIQTRPQSLKPSPSPVLQASSTQIVVNPTPQVKGDYTKTPSSLAPLSVPTSIQNNKLKISGSAAPYLFVRSVPNSSAIPSIGRVRPGEIYPILDFKNNWYEITLKTGKSGWVSADYVQVIP